MDIRMYVMTHKRIEKIADPMYIPMQVGKAGKEDFGYLADDTGDNISDKNSMYCELTGIYWLWKNMDCDVIGICHYRRYFIKNEKLLEKSYIEKLMKEYSIVIPNSACVRDKDVYEHYQKRHYSRDLDICREVIAEKYPDYLRAYDYSMRTILISPGNMWITKKPIFDRYCIWLFEILFEVEKRIDMTGYDDYQKRVMGFLAERLFRVWLLKQNERITEEYVKMIAPEDFGNADKRRDLLYRQIKLKIQPVLAVYHAKIENRIPVGQVDCRDDFEGKMPVWLCWWQGEAQMPELVRLCEESVKRNLPEEKTAFRLITLENCMEYVTFTTAVLRKFNSEKISLTHLSDLLRAELLYRYGGMWIDATYYLTGPLPEEIFEKEFYTIRFERPVWTSDITGGRWSGNFWRVQPGQRLFQFLMESLWYYWEAEEEMSDYYLIDYVIAAAVEEFSDVRAQLEQCGFCSGNVFGLEKYMNKKYKPERIEKLKKESGFYKLNRRENYAKTNLAGEKTVYGYLLECMENKWQTK